MPKIKRPAKPKLIEKPGRVEAMKAKCAECSGDYVDGREDCQIVGCPLYAYHVLRTKLPDLTWRDHGAHKSANRKAIKDRLRQARRDAAAQIEDAKKAGKAKKSARSK